MEPTTQAIIYALIGVALGAAVTGAWWASDRNVRSSLPSPTTGVPPGVASVLHVLRSSALVVDESDQVLQASAPAYALGLVRGQTVTVAKLAEMVSDVRSDGQIRETELELRRGRGRAAAHVTARVAPLGSRLVLALVEDRTRERRVEAVRRDFVANVSHELKTPVGALNVLAEAVQEAADDPEAVIRFSGRMKTESARLSNLVQQIIELSRLQNDDTLDSASPIPVAGVLAAALDHNAIEAKAKGIVLVRTATPEGLEVFGNPDQVVLALSNLVSNAVTYSPESSTVVVGARRDAMMVDLTVTDQGIGIPADEIDRIFERFYRVDPARHRSTGGTGLGLSIVKHVAASHGGEVRVWSEPGQGSTFTLSLPRRVRSGTAPPPRVGQESEPLRPVGPGETP